jgi:hypothetical protein
MICKFEGCHKSGKIVRGYCQLHYDRILRPFYWRKYSKPKKLVDWQAIGERAMVEFEEWKKTAEPFAVDSGELKKLRVDRRQKK